MAVQSRALILRFPLPLHRVSVGVAIASSIGIGIAPFSARAKDRVSFAFARDRLRARFRCPRFKPRHFDNLVVRNSTPNCSKLSSCTRESAKIARSEFNARAKMPQSRNSHHYDSWCGSVAE